MSQSIRDGSLIMKRSSVRARIRQLCQTGMPGEMLMAPLLPTIRELVTSDSAAFCWFDSRGEVRSLYAERLPPPEISWKGLATDFDAMYRSVIHLSSRMCASSADEIASLNAVGIARDHVLCAVARTKVGPVGQLRLYRSGSAREFSERDRADLASIMRQVTHAVAAAQEHPLPRAALAYEDSEDEELLVTDSSCTIHFASDNGLRLLLMATAREITPTIARTAVGDETARVIRALCAELDATAQGDRAAPLMTLDSKWGRFVLRGYRLSNGHPGHERIAIRIQRQEPTIARLVRAIGQQQLSPRQREIALQIALGRSSQDISRDLGVTLNTVAYHIKQLFIRLNVHTRAQAIEKMLGGDRIARATPPVSSLHRAIPAPCMDPIQGSSCRP